MVATLTLIYRGGGYLYISEEFAPGIAVSLQNLVGGQNNRSVAQPAEYFCGGARAVGTFFQETIGQGRFVFA